MAVADAGLDEFIVSDFDPAACAEGAWGGEWVFFGVSQIRQDVRRQCGDAMTLPQLHRHRENAQALAARTALELKANVIRNCARAAATATRVTS